MSRPPRVVHATSEPLVFFGRAEALALLDGALAGGPAGVVGLVGPGGQGKTAIARHWLTRLPTPPDGTFLWSFYRGKHADSCLREWLAYAEGTTRADVSASWCAERLLAVLRRERWAVVLDGCEVAQHERGDWYGRFLHPDLAWLMEELAAAPTPGVVVLTSRFPFPTMAGRPGWRGVELDRLDAATACALMRRLGVRGDDAALAAVAAGAGWHAKAVELTATWLAHFHGGDAAALPAVASGGDLEGSVAAALGLFLRDLAAEQQDIVALATAFHDPPGEGLLLDYLASGAVRALLHETRGREYLPLMDRERGWLSAQVNQLITLRLLERVEPGPVIDAHPLVRRAFEPGAGARQNALARGGFLRGRPDRRRPETLDEARAAVELFHAHCDAGLWAEADSTFVALDNPKYRLLAPAFERDLLLRFFPERDWRRPPLWPGFGRWRSLAICLELLGDFESALAVYRPGDAALRGDALIALGELGPILDTQAVPAPWQSLWQAYRCHAMCLSGAVDEAVRLARTLVPVDVYEWAHVFEALLRGNALAGLDLRGMQGTGDHPWADLTRRRICADLRRRTEGPAAGLEAEYLSLIAASDRVGLPLERVLTRLSLVALLEAQGRTAEALTTVRAAKGMAQPARLRVLEADALAREAQLLSRTGDAETQQVVTRAEAARWVLGLQGPPRP